MDHFEINPQATQICRTLQEASYQSYIVGGCVRDLLLNIIPKDWDICTNATPEQIISLFPKTIPTGLKHGTITVVMGEGVENHFEVTTFRIEGEYKDGRRPEEVFFVSTIEQDLARRDLTINAIAMDPISKQMIDPYHGIDDLNAKIIRAVGDPNARFQEDGLRIMRAARFAARFNYAIDETTMQGMSNNLATLSMVSKERISDELCKTLMTDHPSYGFSILKASGALKIVCPLLEDELQLLDHCKGELETRLAFLYVGCDTRLMKEELISLKLSNKEINRVVFQLELLDRFLDAFRENTTDAYVQFIAFIKNKTMDDYDHSLRQFIALAKALELGFEAWLAKFADVIVLSRKEMTISGDDLLKIGMPPGPKFKETLDRCYQHVLQYPKHNSIDYLVKLAQSEE